MALRVVCEWGNKVKGAAPFAGALEMKKITKA